MKLLTCTTVLATLYAAAVPGRLRRTGVEGTGALLPAERAARDCTRPSLIVWPGGTMPGKTC